MSNTEYYGHNFCLICKQRWRDCWGAFHLVFQFALFVVLLYNLLVLSTNFHVHFHMFQSITCHFTYSLRIFTYCFKRVPNIFTRTTLFTTNITGKFGSITKLLTEKTLRQNYTTISTPKWQYILTTLQQYRIQCSQPSSYKLFKSRSNPCLPSHFTTVTFSSVAQIPAEILSLNSLKWYETFFFLLVVFL